MADKLCCFDVLIFRNNSTDIELTLRKMKAIDPLHTSASSSITERSKVKLPSNCLQGKIGSVEIGKRLYVW